MNDGSLVELEDGSLSEIHPVDRIDTLLWLPTTEVPVCADKLINTEDNETVAARASLGRDV